MSSFTQTIAVGNIGKKPESFQTKSGLVIARFSVAVSNREKVDGQWDDVTIWYNCKAFGQQAEFTLANLNRGSRVMVNGIMKSRKYTDKTGSERTSWELIANNFKGVIALDRPAENGRAAVKSPAQNARAAVKSNDFSDEEIPF